MAISTFLAQGGRDDPPYEKHIRCQTPLADLLTFLNINKGFFLGRQLFGSFHEKADDLEKKTLFRIP